VRVQDIYVRANPATGIISVEANIRNTLPLSNEVSVEFTVSPAAGGKPREVLVDKGYFEEIDAQLR